MNNKASKKRILWINHFVPYPPKGGLLVRTNGLLEGVAKEHHVSLHCLIQPRILAPYFDGLEQGLSKAKEHLSSLVDELQWFSLPSESHRLNRVALAFASVFTRDPYSVNWLYSRQFKQHIHKLLAEQHFDLIHIDTMGLAQYLPDNLPCPVIVNHHNAEHAMMWRRADKQSNPLKAWYFKMEGDKIARYDAKQMQRLPLQICCSEGDAQELRQLGAQQVELVPNGVKYLQVAERNIESGHLVFVGGLDWYPNHDAVVYLLTELWPALSKAFPQLHLDIIGKDPSEQILALAGGFSNVTVHGFVDDLNYYYQRAMACICPLRDGGGTKLKVLEAMSHGLVVLGSDIAFEGIAVADRQNGMVANSLEEYRAALEQLLAEPGTAQQIGGAANQLVAEKYDAKQIARDYSRMIRQVVEAG